MDCGLCTKVSKQKQQSTYNTSSLSRRNTAIVLNQDVNFYSFITNLKDVCWGSRAFYNTYQTYLRTKTTNSLLY